MQEALVFHLQRFSITTGGHPYGRVFSGCNLRALVQQSRKPTHGAVAGEKVTRYTVDALVRELVKTNRLPTRAAAASR
jgi:hypothetical protein